VLDHELVHATDIYNGNLDIWRTMANQLGNPQLADIMMEYHAYLSSERVEREFGVDYGATDKVKVLGSMLPPQFLNFFNR
jgi:hypothetical protein